jgi:hypothetical protein
LLTHACYAESQVELKAAMDFNKPVIMCCGSVEFDAQTGNYKFVDDFLSLRNLEWMVNVLKAQASDPVDKDRILAEIEDSDGGAQALNHNVSVAISGAVAAESEGGIAMTAIQAAMCGEPEQLADIPESALAAAVRVAAALNAVEPLGILLARGAPVDVPTSA